MFLTVQDIRDAGISRTNGGLYDGKKLVENTHVTKYANRHKKAINHADNHQARRELNQEADGSEGKHPRPYRFLCGHHITPDYLKK